MEAGRMGYWKTEHFIHPSSFKDQRISQKLTQCPLSPHMQIHLPDLRDKTPKKDIN